MFVLTDLPYPHEALEPAVSSDTLRFHHDKHHAKYVEVTNQLLANHEHGPFATLEEVVRHAAERSEQKLFNNAGQAWNHGFFWESMAPDPEAPSGALAQAIERDFGGMDGLRKAFVTEGVGHFASGWVWIVAEGDRLSVVSTHDADTVITRPGLTPVLLCDLWEHAYYLDYQNNRQAFLETWFDQVANWSFAEAQYAAATGAGQGWRYPPKQG